ncbi:MAG: YdcF family protein [Reichenbachiella sp.]
MNRSHSLICLLLILLSSGCMISQRKSLSYLEEATAHPYDIIVVPGVPYEGEEISSTMKGRINWSKYLYDNGIAKNIMYTGGAVYSPYYEAEIMALTAKEMGIPDSVIYIETRAEHSTENIYYSYKKAKLLGFDRIALATDPFQAKMLKRYIRKVVDKNVGVIPFFYDSLETIENREYVINDSLAYKPDFISILKRESWWKRFRGTRGHNVNEEYYNE